MSKFPPFFGLLAVCDGYDTDEQSTRSDPIINVQGLVKLNFGFDVLYLGVALKTSAIHISIYRGIALFLRYNSIQFCFVFIVRVPNIDMRRIYGKVVCRILRVFHVSEFCVMCVGLMALVSCSVGWVLGHFSCRKS